MNKRFSGKRKITETWQRQYMTDNGTVYFLIRENDRIQLGDEFNYVFIEKSDATNGQVIAHDEPVDKAKLIYGLENLHSLRAQDANEIADLFFSDDSSNESFKNRKTQTRKLSESKVSIKRK